MLVRFQDPRPEAVRFLVWSGQGVLVHEGHVGVLEVGEPAPGTRPCAGADVVPDARQQVRNVTGYRNLP